MATGHIRVRVEDNFSEVERRVERIAPNLNLATAKGTRAAGAALIQALEMGDNSSAEWQPDFLSLGERSIFTAHSTEDPQAFQEFGTRAHPIFVRNAKALRFFWNKVRGVRFFHHVQHPGQTAKPYVQRMGEFAERGMIDEFERAWEDGLEGRNPA